MNIKKISAAAMSAMLCLSMMSGCSDKNAEKNDADETGLVSYVEEPAETNAVTQKIDDNAVDPSVMVDLNEKVSDKMYNRSLLNEGNLARLNTVMKKAQNGEDITVGVIGGSITQGSSASNTQNSYAVKFSKIWEEMFPSCKVNFVNAGIGGTNSYLGVHRVDEQLLAAEPDVVVVEFSVNDEDKTMHKYSYDSLVRKILGAPNSPAVILLFTTQENGTSLQETHKEIGTAYNLPMISYREAVYPEVAAGTLNWKDISPDNIHPNDAGHEIINQLLSRYLKDVYSKLDDSSDYDTTFNTPALTKDYYANAALYNASQITATAMDGYEIGGNKVYNQFNDNWVTSGGGTLTFDVECRNFGIFFLRTVDGKSGTYEVYVDGERKGKMEADFKGGWGNYGFTQQFIIGNDTQKHTIEIKAADGSEDKGITILALMMS